MSVTTPPATFTDRALAAVRRGFSIIPCQPHGKGPLLRGAKSRVNTEEGVRAFAAQVPVDANYGICSDENFTVLETDNRERFTALIGKPLPTTFCVSARNNRGYWVFKQTPKTLAVTTCPTVPELFEWRHTNQYCVGFGSIHPDTGKEYRIVSDVAPAFFPDWLVERLLALDKEAPSFKSGVAGAPDENALKTLKDRYLQNLDPQDLFGLENFQIDSLHPTLMEFAGLLHDGVRTVDEIADILERLAADYGHRQARGRQEVLDIAEWVIKKEPCDLEPINLPPVWVYSAQKPGSSQDSCLWTFSTEESYAVFKNRCEQTPAWAFAAEWKDPEGWPELPANYEAWAASQTAQEDPRLLTHAALKAARNATPNPEIVVGLFPENSVNILVGDSGLGKTPFVVQLAVCIALGADFLGQKTVQKKVMMVDYENSEALADVVSQICEHLGLPADFEMDPKWFRIVQNVDAADVLKLAREFKPAFVVVDSLRGFCSTADTKNETASKLITELQGHKTAFLLMHHVRKNSTEKHDKRQPLEKEERVLDWLEAAAGARALINQTFTRIAIDHSKADNADLILRGFYKGRGEFGPWKLARNYSEQHGEPIGYNRLTGTALLDIEQSVFFDALPKDQPMSYKEIQHSLGQSEGQITRFLAACDNAGVVITTGKRKTRSRRYTFPAEKKPPKTAEELELEKSVREAFA